MNINPFKFGADASSDANGAAVCHTILQDMIGDATISVPRGDLSGMRGLFWSHVSLSLTTLYFPGGTMRLSAAGMRDEGIVILRAMDGRLSLMQRQRRVDAAKADVVFLAANAPLSIVLPDGGRLDCAYLPGHALGSARRRLSPLLLQPIAGESLPLQLLITYAGYLLQHDRQARSDADMMIAHFYALLPVLADTAVGGIPRIPPSDRLGSIKAYIEDHLADSTFSIADLARKEGVTTRAIQKLFTQEGSTFSGYLLERRLDLAKTAILLSGTFAPITQVAFDVGFDDPSYFSRAFRKRYGVTPRDLRRSRASGRAGSAPRQEAGEDVRTPRNARPLDRS